MSNARFCFYHFLDTFQAGHYGQYMVVFKQFEAHHAYKRYALKKTCT